IVDLDPDSPPIHGVFIDFSQVIGNLLRNAIDAMHEAEEKVLKVQSRHHNGRLVLRISDTGYGISDDAKKNLFKPFFTTKPKGKDAAPGEPTGTGLGLSHSRSILARYGADINVESEVGKGATFTVTIPLHRRPVT
ncbi:HAMP domain-containing histidine kinase, partial [bacterium]|nr:HAMP domain-containing histidine kinase [bacterium]